MSKFKDDMTAQQAAMFIRDHALGLMGQAKAAKLDMLTYLLEMAVAEADEIVTSLDDGTKKPKKR